MCYMKIWVTFSICFLVNTNCLFAQSPYTFKKKKDWSLTIGSATLFTGGLLINANITPLTPSEIDNLSASQVNAFDRSATNNWSPNASKISDYLQGGATILPLSLLAFKPIRKDSPKMGLLLAQSYLITKGLTQITKGTVQRIRPFVYNDVVDLEEKIRKTAKRSFFSGHTSGAAVFSFFTAKVFSDYYPKSKWKPLVWTGAALIPALTGYHRYLAGKHYTTDVIVGYSVGALVGILIPAIHKSIDNKHSLNWQVRPIGLVVYYSF